MLVIKPKCPRLQYCHGGSGIFDIIQNIVKKSANSALAKQVVNTAANSALGKKVINTATKSTLGKKVIKAATNKNVRKYVKKAAASTIGKEARAALISGLSQASENAANTAFAKLGLTPLPKPTPPPPQSRKRKRGPSKKKKNKIKKSKLNNIVNGSGIILE